MAMSELFKKSFLEIRKDLDEGALTSESLSESLLGRAQDENKKNNALISFCEDSLMKEAQLADERLKSGERSALLGVPIVLKDIISCKGHRLTAASKMLENFVAPYDATVTTKLKQAGVPILAKANCDEFAMGSSNENSFFGAVKNPWDLERVPGGSSGGSAAAVASGMSPISLGTDTGGSIRQPAALTGITGLKPTYGRVSRYGVVAFASSLDQVGPMCSDAFSSAAVLECISGHDLHDATSSQAKVPSFLRSTIAWSERKDLKGLRIGLPKQFFVEGLDPVVAQEINKVADFYKSEGAEIVDIELPHVKHSMATYYIICSSEASSNLARYDGVHYGHRSERKTSNLDELYSRNRAEGFGDEVTLRILLGTFSLSSGYYDAYYHKASQVRELMRQDYKNAFSKVDCILGPTSPSTAFKLGEKGKDPVQMYLSDIYTLATNLAGIPAISFNSDSDSKLPIGVHLQGSWWGEEKLLGLAAYYQKRHPNSLRKADS